MKKTVQIVLTLLLLTCIYCYARIAGTVSFVQETEGENCAGEMDEETEKEIISKMKVTVGGVMETAELTGQEETEETEESEVQRYYREAIESAQLDWEWVIKPGEYDFIFLGETYIAVSQYNGKYGVVDENKVSIFSEKYDSISPYSENMAKACNDGKYFYIDKMGEKVIEGAFQDAKSFSEKRAAVQMEGSWGYINPNGRVVIECRYEQANPFKEGYASVKEENGWGFIDRNGRMTVSCQYDEVKDYSEGLAAVKKDGKWGYIDESGQMVIDLMYDDAGSFSEGKAAVKLEDYTEDGLDAWAYINSENTVVLGCYIDRQIPTFSMYASEFHDGLAYIVDEVPTIINEKGQEVFDSPFFITGHADPKYKAIPGYLFTDDLMKERTYGLVGLDGECLLEPVFYDVDGPYEDYVRVEVVIDEKPYSGVIRLKEKQPDKNSSLLWKSWIVDEPVVSWDDKFGFIITKMSGEEIEGVIVIGDDADDWYWSQGLGCEKCNQFKGIVKEKRAECTFEYEGYPAEVTFFFQENNRIEAAVKCDQLDMDMCHEFRPEHFSDIGGPWNDDLSSAPVYLETWGEVNLISATTDDNHSNPYFCITDEDGNVLYEGGLINGFDFWDIFVEDLNHDGLQDIWTVLCGSVDDALETGTLVDIFYQTGDGRFDHIWRRGGSSWLGKYRGEYLVTRFCSAENYADISETVLTQEEAEQMIGKKIVIQNKLFVSYDSERRRGIREDRKPPARESMIIEYCSTYPQYDWEPVSPDMDSGGFYPDTYPDEELREAVGEEYYEKINGVFYNMCSAWQLFYTLEGEDKLIMHSMLTGQNFILEKEIADN